MQLHPEDRPETLHASPPIAYHSGHGRPPQEQLPPTPEATPKSHTGETPSHATEGDPRSDTAKANKPRRFSIRTELTPEDPEKAARHLSTIRLGSVTPEQFKELFPSGCLQDAMCHEGTDAEGRPHVYFADDVLEAELRQPATGRTQPGPSHQALFALALLRLEQTQEPEMAELRSRAAAKPLDQIPPLALQYLLHTADGGWAPEVYICEDMARLAFKDGVRAADLLAPLVQ